MTRSSLLRMWWAAPMALVAGSAIGVAIVVGPTVGEQVGVPPELVVPVAGDGGATTPVATTTPHPAKTRRPGVAPTRTTSPTATFPHPSTQVVEPRRPVVTQSAENDGSESGGDTGYSHEGGDG